MTSTLLKPVAAAAAVLLAACAGTTAVPPAAPPAGPSTDAVRPDRSVRPAVGEAPDLSLPAIERFTLANGLDVLVMQKRDLPLVQMSVIIRAGSVRDTATAPGVASMTAAMLDEGAAGRSSLEIAEAFEALGARFGIGAGAHTATLSLRTTTQRLPDALRIAADVLLRPDFPAHELDRLRVERLTALVRRHDQPAAVAGALADETLFGADHPYGRFAVGTEASLRAMTAAELRAFHERFYRPNAAAVVIVGDLDAARARTLVEDAFGEWRPGVAARDVVPDPTQVRGRAIYLVDMPGSAQSVVRLGRIGVPRSSPDYYALEVMNVILGGSFTSRLNQNLREDKGYTYGAGSGFGYMPSAGAWSASADIQTQSTGPAIAEFMRELRGMHEAIPSDEVERARNFLAMRHPAGFQSVAGIAARIAELVQYDLPLNYFADYVDRVLAVTPADVERVAREYIDPDNVAIFVVGDRQVIEQQIRDLDLGPIHIFEVSDILGPVPVLTDH